MSLLVTSPTRRQHAIARFFARLSTTVVIAAAALLPDSALAQRGSPPASLTDAEFWEFFSSKSEPGGSFVSENFVSNELSFQEVIPTLQKSLTPGGVYLGVGPEQNFTYIANLRPRMAVIFDIRRQNAMHHLMYKALMELSPTRAEFVARLFSRPSVARLTMVTDVAVLFDSAGMAEPSDSAFEANHNAIVTTLLERHGFALTADDLATINHVYTVFYHAGPDINYGYRASGRGFPAVPFRSRYPTFGMLQAATNADSVQMAFLATDENYRTVRDMHLRNLIIPVVGNFAGPGAIRAVGDYLKRNGLTVTAFYLSNVEQYLFRGAGDAERFYENVATLPLDSTSTFIRSVPGSSGMSTFTFGASPRGLMGTGGAPIPGGVSVSRLFVRDSAGVRTIQTIQDSAGVPVMRTFQDSSGRLVPRALDSLRADALRRDSLLAMTLRSLAAGRDSTAPPPALAPTRRPVFTVMGSLLTSGLASMRETLDAVAAGQVLSYRDVIEMTKTSGWR
jgi:hypothetical protein